MLKLHYIDSQNRLNIIVNLYKNGNGYEVEDIGTKLGITPTSVYRYLKTAGVTLRVRKHDKNGHFLPNKTTT